MCKLHLHLLLKHNQDSEQHLFVWKKIENIFQQLSGNVYNLKRCILTLFDGRKGVHGTSIFFVGNPL